MQRSPSARETLRRLTELDISLLRVVRRIGAAAARPAFPLGCALADLGDRELEALARGVVADLPSPPRSR
jgi:hypothetical protein